MKHDVLRSVAHNIAASLASGIGLLIGVYDFNVFEDVRRSAAGHITVDFLTGTTSGGRPSQKLAKAIQLYRDALPNFCQKHGVIASDFVLLTARYWVTATAVRFSVTLADRLGRSTCTDYEGYGGARLRVLDGEGRIRPRPIRRLQLCGSRHHR